MESRKENTHHGEQEGGITQQCATGNNPTVCTTGIPPWEQAGSTPTMGAGREYTHRGRTGSNTPTMGEQGVTHPPWETGSMCTVTTMGDGQYVHRYHHGKGAVCAELSPFSLGCWEASLCVNPLLFRVLGGLSVCVIPSSLGC